MAVVTLYYDEFSTGYTVVF